MRRVSTWIIVTLIVTNLISLYFVYRAQREIWLWGLSGAGWPNRAGRGDAQSNWEDGKIRFFELSYGSTLPPDGQTADGIKIDYIHNDPAKGKLAVRSFEIYIDAYNKRMRKLIDNDEAQDSINDDL